MALYDEEELLSRAIRAYFTRRRREGVYSPDQPANTSGLYAYDGQDFIVLVNIKGPLAIYKVKDNERLEYVSPEYWPESLLVEYELVSQ